MTWINIFTLNRSKNCYQNIAVEEDGSNEKMKKKKKKNQALIKYLFMEFSTLHLQYPRVFSSSRNGKHIFEIVNMERDKTSCCSTCKITFSWVEVKAFYLLLYFNHIRHRNPLYVTGEKSFRSLPSLRTPTLYTETKKICEINVPESLMLSQSFSEFDCFCIINKEFCCRNLKFKITSSIICLWFGLIQVNSKF